MSEMFLRRPETWTRAVAVAYGEWIRRERKIQQDFSQNPGEATLKPLLGRYRIARSIPGDFRGEWAHEAVRIDLGSGTRGFAAAVIRWSRASKERCRGKQQISAASKVLWHLAPMQGFIFDQQMFAALKKNGLRFQAAETTSPDLTAQNPHEASFLAAAESWRILFAPLIGPVAKRATELFHEPLLAPRIFDKALWIEGSKSPDSVPNSEQPQSCAEGAILAAEVHALVSAHLDEVLP